MSFSIAKVRTKQPEVRKDQLLEAAETLFAQKGYAETTVADIAEAAGVAKGTFYLYFPSKDHCVVALKRKLADGLIDRFLEVLAPEYEKMATGIPSDVEAVARQLIEESFAYGIEHTDTHRNLFHRGDSLEVDQVGLEAEEAITNCLTQLFTGMNHFGVATVTRPEFTAKILFAGIHWTLEQVLASGADTQKLADLKEAAVEVIVRSLGVRKPQ